MPGTPGIPTGIDQAPNGSEILSPQDKVGDLESKARTIKDAISSSPQEAAYAISDIDLQAIAYAGALTQNRVQIQFEHGRTRENITLGLNPESVIETVATAEWSETGSGIVLKYPHKNADESRSIRSHTEFRVSQDTAVKLYTEAVKALGADPVQCAEKLTQYPSLNGKDASKGIGLAITSKVAAERERAVLEEQAARGDEQLADLRKREAQAQQEEVEALRAENVKLKGDLSSALEGQLGLLDGVVSNLSSELGENLKAQIQKIRENYRTSQNLETFITEAAQALDLYNTIVKAQKS